MAATYIEYVTSPSTSAIGRTIFKRPGIERPALAALPYYGDWKPAAAPGVTDHSALPQTLKTLLVAIDVTLVVTDVAELGFKCALVARQIGTFWEVAASLALSSIRPSISIGLLGNQVDADLKEVLIPIGSRFG